MIKETMQVYDENERIEQLIKAAKKKNRLIKVLMQCFKMPVDIIKFFKSFSNKSQALWIIIRESKAFQQWEKTNKGGK